ncbi:hypothetical protein TIFTF001_030489 [Ficus carica]|uniref:Uncharacterized protein n=1 Tax=Ficus carica TaxID=3494 RepID=A0AA88J3V6_FICCA|nr:hypothetical protein TIFTF001_030489 [Ficus carica]
MRGRERVGIQLERESVSLERPPCDAANPWGSTFVLESPSSPEHTAMGKVKCPALIILPDTWCFSCTMSYDDVLVHTDSFEACELELVTP